MDFQENTKLLLKDEVFQIVGAAIEVLNQVGHGFYEKPYENALVVKFGLRQIPCQQRKSFEMLYKRQRIGEFTPDLIAFDAVIVDAKTIDRITDVERGQMLNYLRITKLRVGCRSDSKFQASQAGVGTHRFLNFNSCQFVVNQSL